MILSKQLLLETLETLAAPHQKFLAEFELKNQTVPAEAPEVIQALRAMNAVETYKQTAKKLLAS